MVNYQYELDKVEQRHEEYINHHRIAARKGFLKRLGRGSLTLDPDPAAGSPAAGDPAAGDPAAGDPAAGDPAAGDPAAGDSRGGRSCGGRSCGGAILRRAIPRLGSSRFNSPPLKRETPTDLPPAGVKQTPEPEGREFRPLPLPWHLRLIHPVLWGYRGPAPELAISPQPATILVRTNKFSRLAGLLCVRDTDRIGNGSRTSAAPMRIQGTPLS